MKKVSQNTINKLSNDLFSYALVDKKLIHLNDSLEFSLFQEDTPTHLSLFLKSGTVINRHHLKLINEADQLFIRSNDKAKYYEYLENNLDFLLKDDSLSLDEKTDLIYSATSELTQNLYSNPEALENVQLSQKIVAPIVNTVLGDKKTISSYIKIIECDYYTYTHSLNVSVYSICLGLELGLEESKLKKLGISALLHDLGKSKIDLTLVNKDGSLSQDEYEDMQEHTILGLELVKLIGITDADILSGVVHHHEKIDGSGYPDGLKGKEIPLFPRIISVCDVFDALTTNRTYKDALTSFAALLIMKKEMNTKLDMKIVEKFIKMLHSS